MKRQIIALFLVVSMLLGIVIQPTTVRAAENEAGDKLSVAQTSGQLAAVKELEASVINGVSYDPDQEVVIVVETEGETLVDYAEDSVADYAATAQGEKVQQKLLALQDKIKAKVEAVSEDASVKDSESFITVMNGFTVKATYKDLEAIQEVTGVKRAYVAGKYDVPVTEPANDVNMAFSTGMIGAGLANESGYTGKGAVVAVLDTGIDYNHEAFSVNPEAVKYTTDEMKAMINEKSETLNSGADGNVISSKIIFTYDYADKDNDVYPNSSSHGVHVAGTVAGNNGKDFKGVAPDAQLMSMKVFSDTDDGAYDSDIIAALEDAVLLGADVINMSLGSPAGFTESADEVTQDMYDRIGEAGVNLMVSAGNEYNQGYTTTPYDLPYADTPDYGLVGSPSTYATSLSVASIENTHLTTNYFTLGETKIPYIDNAEDSLKQPKLTSLDGQSLEYVPAGLGSVEECAAAGLEGKVALIQRGNLSFTDKVANAYNEGAVAVIIYNNEGGTISMSVANYFVPAVSITQADGEAMLNAENKTVTFTSKASSFENETAWQMSDFSSWGTTPNLTLKPEITAPGGSIYSSVAGGGYESYNGTSMAAPHMAGAAAVLKQYVNEKFNDSTAVEKWQLINNLLMSTAIPAADKVNGGYYSPRKQGSGLVNIDEAINAEAYLYTGNMNRPKIEMGDSETGNYSFSFSAYNYGTEAKTYDLSAAVQSDYPAYDGRNIYSTLSDLTLEEGVDYTISYTVGGESVNAVTVQPGNSVEVAATITLTQDAIDFLNNYFVNGTYIEGFVFLNAGEEEVELSIPFLGFLGDWGNLQLFDGTVYDEDAYYFASSVLGAFEYKGSKTYIETLGENSFTGKLDKENIAYSPNYVANKFGINSPTWLTSDTGLLRNAKDIQYTITNSEGQVVENHSYITGDEGKSFYYINGGFITSATDLEYLQEGGFDGTTLPEGNYTMTISATPAGGEDQQTLTYNFYVDTTAPEYKGYEVVDNEDGTKVLKLYATDDQTVQGINLYIAIETPEGKVGTVSLDDVASYIDLLVDNNIGLEDCEAMKAALPTVADYSTDENGVTTMAWDVTGYETLLDLFSKYIPVIFGEGYTLASDSLYTTPVDYAWNLADSYYAVVIGQATFRVADNENLPIKGAAIKVNGVKYFTDENGMVVLNNLIAGKYVAILDSVPRGYIRKIGAIKIFKITADEPKVEINYGVVKFGNIFRK